MKMRDDIILCPECEVEISVLDGKIARHERGLAYIPYKLYKKIEKISGTSVKEQAKRNLCLGSSVRITARSCRKEEENGN